MTASRTAGKWVAQIMVGGRSIYLGTYESVEAAAKAYKQAAKQAAKLHHGEYAHV